MKIDDASGKLPNLPAVTSTGNAAVHPGTSAATNAAASAAGGRALQADKVSLSGTLHALSAPADAPIDSAKVDKVRAAIADGSFRADAGRIADGLIAASRELADRARPTAP